MIRGGLAVMLQQWLAVPFEMFMEIIGRTISEMADLQVSVQAHYCHGDEAPTAKEEASPTVVLTAPPAEQPAVGETGDNKEGFSRHC
ncbi:hypothetical protein GOODEAATRI_011735 [Goodea atripinnis]|uniref:Uncharacterized protein n=1 Tax=Goodea atripinnis TaxID=208336 RepID=A0ABV0MJ05_9TELE